MSDSSNDTSSVRRAGLSVTDQGVVSLSNVLTTILVAKAVDPTSFGVYMLLFSTVFILGSISESLVAGPARVLGIRAEPSEGRAYLDSQLAIQLALGGALALGAAGVMIGLFSMDTVTSVAFGLCIFFWQLQELMRVLQLIGLRVRHLLFMDVLNHSCRVGFLTGAGLIGILDISTALLAIALGSAIGLLVGLRSTGVRISPLRLIGTATKQNWNYGRWLLMESAVSLASTRLYIYFTALWVDLRAAGAFGAVQTLLNALNVLLLGTVNIVTPIARTRLVRDGYDEWKNWLFRVGIALSALTAALTMLLAVFAEPLLALLFRPEYAAYALLVPLLGVATILRSPNSMLAVAFRTAEKPEVGFTANATSAAVTLAAAYPMLQAWGLYGAAFGIVITQLCWLAVYSKHVVLKRALSRENVAALSGIRAG